MRAELGLPSVKGDDEHGGGMTGGFGGSMGGAGQGGKGKRPISVKFEIPYFTTSGIQVRYLKIIEPKVSAVAIRALLTTYASLFARLFLPLIIIGRVVVFAHYMLRNGSPAVAGNLQPFLILLALLAVRSIARAMKCPPRGPERCDGPQAVRICLDFVLSCAVTLTHLALVAISFASLGSIHHAVWRHSG